MFSLYGVRSFQHFHKMRVHLYAKARMTFVKQLVF